MYSVYYSPWYLVFNKNNSLIFFFFLILLIYLFFLFMAVLGLRFCARAFSSCGKWGPLFIAVRGPLITAASPVVEHRLQTHRVSNCGSRAQPLRSMRDPPRPGLEPTSPALAGRLWTTAPPGKPSLIFLMFYNYILFSFFLNVMSSNQSFTSVNSFSIKYVWGLPSPKDMAVLWNWIFFSREREKRQAAEALCGFQTFPVVPVHC